MIRLPKGLLLTQRRSGVRTYLVKRQCTGFLPMPSNTALCRAARFAHRMIYQPWGRFAMEKPPDEPLRADEGRLDSWKKIAVYLKRDVTTVQRWEKREGMP